MRTSTSVEKSISVEFLSCEVVAPLVAAWGVEAEDEAPVPGTGFARGSLPTRLTAFLAGRMSGIPWNGGGSDERRTG